MMKHQVKGLTLLLCMLLTAYEIYPVARAAEEQGKEPTHVYLEGVEIAPGVFEYRSDDGTVVISEPWEAADESKIIFVEPWLGDIMMDGTPVSVWGEDGKLVAPVAYQGSIYVPLSTVELWLGTEMQWTPELNIIEFSLDKTYVSYPRRTVPDGIELGEAMKQFVPAEEGQMVEAMFCPDIFLALNGEEFVEFTNVRDEAVHVILVNDSVYLPVRGVSEFCGKTVSWEQNGVGEYFVSVD